MKNLNRLLKKLERNFNQLEKNLLKLKSLWLRAKKLLEQFLVIALLMLPALSYSQSKNEKYPKQTVINGDTVVILLLHQAVEMNESFLEMQSKIDSINSVADTLKSVVIVEQNEAEKFEWQFNEATRKLDRKHTIQHRIEVGRDIVLCFGLITGFVLVTDWLNQQ